MTSPSKNLRSAISAAGPQSSLPFVKMHGLGNDFVLIDSVGAEPSALTQVEITPSLAQQICDRRFGIGADQILWLRQPHDSACVIRMEILNADGSIAEMCGNGIRAVGLYLSRYGIMGPQESYAIETLAGIQVVQVQKDSVRVNMGVPRLLGGFQNPAQGEVLHIQSPTQNQSMHFFEVNVGNPHAVFFVEDVDQFSVAEIGALVEHHPRFPKRTNVEFVEVVSSSQIKVRVWERGAGITLACGTGACASAAAAIVLKKVGSNVKVSLPGGDLLMNWAGTAAPIFMEGPACEVFRGTYRL